MFNVEYSWDNTPQEGNYGVRSRNFDSLDQAYQFSAAVIARATKRNAESPLCCGQPEDHFIVDLRITRVEYGGRRLPEWQGTLLTLFFDGLDEHAMWLSQRTGRIMHF